MKYLIVGLGNPGKEYEKTRHNAGWVILDQAFPELEWERDSYGIAGKATFSFGDSQILFVKPVTLMNNSGESVEYFVSKKGFLSENTIVVYDDIDLPLGTMKISFDRGSGGHNGIKSIEEHLGSREFIRIRVGISKVLENGELVKPNVLGKFEESEIEVLEGVSKKVKDALSLLVKEGKEKAMTMFN
jgi:PTH1 family peptidyl-tRNA hydrolase